MPTIHEADSYIVPILQGDDQHPGVRGTATFCSVEQQYFLVTAAHVLDGNGTIYFGAGIIGAGTSRAVTETSLPSSQNRDDDIFDLAIIPLSDEEAQRLIEQDRQAIPVSAWDVNDVSTPQKGYVFTGFLHSGLERDGPRQIIAPRRMSAITQALPDNRITRLGLDSATHIVGQFRRRRVIGEQNSLVMAPEPYGMSGGPVWASRTNSDQLVWVGIGIEYRQNESVLVGIRLGAMVALMRARHPAVASGLPESRNGRFIAPS